MKFTLVQSESCDWYVVPVERRDEWYEKWCCHEDVPSWAVYVQDPGHVQFDIFECTL